MHGVNIGNFYILPPPYIYWTKREVNPQ